MSEKDWNLEAVEEAGQMEELRREKAARLAEELAEKQKQGEQFKATSAHWDRLWENIDRINKGEMI